MMWKALLSMLACCACGRITSEEDAGAPDASADVAIDVVQDVLVNVVCPDASAAGEPCTRNGLVCEYGTYFDLVCDDVVVCKSGIFVDVPPPPDCATKYEFDAGCPTDPLEGGTSCPMENAVCDYPALHCHCSSACVVPNPGWYCIASPPNCPALRPRLGTSCSGEGTQCARGSRRAES